MPAQRNAAGGARIAAPTKKRSSRRGVWGLLLTVLLPPVGLMYIWRRRLFYARGRVLLTVLATLEMAIAVTFFLPRVRIAPTLPVPQETVRFTPSPQSDVQTALDSLDELLQSRQVAAAPEETTSPEVVQQKIAEQQEILNTIVYSVYHNAALYHKAETCGTQQNKRRLTIRQALQEGLSPCQDCNPVVYEPMSISPQNISQVTSTEPPDNYPLLSGETAAFDGDADWGALAP